MEERVETPHLRDARKKKEKDEHSLEFLGD
jgi:hypothetical protein